MSGSKRLPALVGAVLAVLATAVVTSTQASSAGSGCTIPAAALQATTAHDLIALDVGPMETMYSQSEAAVKHPTSGEIMLGGAMSNATGSSVRHLEVHICSKDGSQVVRNASPSISLTDTTANGAPQTVPVAVMQGVGQGVADLHYGNNVSMPAGHTYLAIVSLGADRAGFSFTVGDHGIVWGAPTNVAAAAPAPPATAATAAPTAMGSMSPGAGGGMGTGSSAPAPAPSTAPTPAAPPGTGAPTPHTGVVTDAAPVAGLGAAAVGASLCVAGRRRRRRRERGLFRTPARAACRSARPARPAGSRPGTRGRR
jgi:hypothetical protein